MSKFNDLLDTINASQKEVGRYVGDCSLALRAFRDAFTSYLACPDPLITQPRPSEDDDPITIYGEHAAMEMQDDGFFSVKYEITLPGTNQFIGFAVSIRKDANKYILRIRDEEFSIPCQYQPVDFHPACETLYRNITEYFQTALKRMQCGEPCKIGFVVGKRN